MDVLYAISTVGFPIAAFLLIYIDLRKLINKQHIVLEHLVNKIDKLIGNGR